MSYPQADLELLALRTGVRHGPVSGHGDHFVFSFSKAASFASVPAATFERMVEDGLLDGAGAVTAKGREAARALIGGPAP